MKAIKQKTDFVNNLNDIYGEIHGIKVEPTDTFTDLLNKFYSIMRKWKICQGEWTDHGSRTCNTAEWCMCYSVFMSTVKIQFEFFSLFGDVPEDLLAYGKEPQGK